MTDDDRVQELLNAWGCFTPHVSAAEVAAKRADLHALITAVRADEHQRPAGVGVLGAGIEDKIQAVLTELAPPGAELTPALKNEIRRRVQETLREALEHSGLPSASALAGLMAAMMTIKPKAP